MSKKRDKNWKKREAAKIARDPDVLASVRKALADIEAGNTIPLSRFAEEVKKRSKKRKKRRQ